MIQRLTTARELHDAWMRDDPDYAAAWDASEEESTLANALIAARSQAKMTQEQVAEKMGTSQAFVARLERARGMPSTRTLQRFAAATGSKLRISFAPLPDAPKGTGQR